MLAMTRRVIGRRASGIGVAAAGAGLTDGGGFTAGAANSAAGGFSIGSDAGEESPPACSKKVVPATRAAKTSRLPRLLKNVRMEKAGRRGHAFVPPCTASVGALAGANETRNCQSSSRHEHEWFGWLACRRQGRWLSAANRGLCRRGRSHYTAAGIIRSRAAEVGALCVQVSATLRRLGHRSEATRPPRISMRSRLQEPTSSGRISVLMLSQ